ncbi:MAG: hypothetical protein DMG00_30540, partial [Acidobacteria bacterium]
MNFGISTTIWDRLFGTFQPTNEPATDYVFWSTIRSYWNFDLSKFEAPSLSEVERPANEVADRALGWLETVKSLRFFGWVHFYDAHSPYAPPEPYRTRFA